MNRTPQKNVQLIFPILNGPGCAVAVEIVPLVPSWTQYLDQVRGSFHLPSGRPVSFAASRPGPDRLDCPAFRLISFSGRQSWKLLVPCGPFGQPASVAVPIGSLVQLAVIQTDVRISPAGHQIRWRNCALSCSSHLLCPASPAI